MKNKDVTDYIKNATEEQIAIMKELRKLIFSVVPEVNEQYKWSRPVYAIGKDFCYIKTAKKHVSFGFFEYGKMITNKDKIEGTGRNMRHVKIKEVSQIAALHIGKMIKEVLA